MEFEGARDMLHVSFFIQVLSWSPGEGRSAHLVIQPLAPRPHPLPAPLPAFLFQPM